MITINIIISIFSFILFLFLFASYELARANMLQHAAESAAYEGARAGIVPGANPQKVRDACGFVLGSVGIRDSQITVEPAVIDPDTEKIKVLIEVPLRQNTLIAPFLFRDPVFRGECEMAREVL